MLAVAEAGLKTQLCLFFFFFSSGYHGQSLFILSFNFFICKLRLTWPNYFWIVELFRKFFCHVCTHFSSARSPFG